MTIFGKYKVALFVLVGVNTHNYNCKENMYLVSELQGIVIRLMHIIEFVL